MTFEFNRKDAKKKRKGSQGFFELAHKRKFEKDLTAKGTKKKRKGSQSLIVKTLRTFA
ncbi:hypothetical protein [Flavobacterium nitrogenifigens]|uniref:hypothetical protein n=1 Tax=Flavobacterium nitrogenifigens TaxID=1617283 RepID=UPI00163DE521|nr:hypothetical protein [Flavobacterium nitrogenifigens]